MSRFIDGSDRRERLRLPDCIDVYVASNIPVRVVDMFVDELNLGKLAHEVISLGHDRTLLASMGAKARDATGADTLTVLAGRGYFSGAEVLACEKAGVVPICPSR